MIYVKFVQLRWPFFLRQDHTYGIFILDATFIPPIKIGGYDFVHA